MDSSADGVASLQGVTAHRGKHLYRKRVVVFVVEHILVSNGLDERFLSALDNFEIDVPDEVGVAAGYALGVFDDRGAGALPVSFRKGCYRTASKHYPPSTGISPLW